LRIGGIDTDHDWVFCGDPSIGQSLRGGNVAAAREDFSVEEYADI